MDTKRVMERANNLMVEIEVLSLTLDGLTTGEIRQTLSDMHDAAKSIRNEAEYELLVSEDQTHGNRVPDTSI